MKYKYLNILLIISILVSGCGIIKPEIKNIHTNNKYDNKPTFLIKKGISGKILNYYYNRINLAYDINEINKLLLKKHLDYKNKIILKINNFEYKIIKLDSFNFKHNILVESEIIIEHGKEKNSFKDIYEVERKLNKRHKQKKYISYAIKKSLAKLIKNEINNRGNNE